MNHLAVRSLAALVLAAGGCGGDTSIRIALVFDDGLGLDTAEVTLDGRTESGPIAHELLLLVPDDLAGMTMPMEVWGSRDGRRVAFGAATPVPELGSTVAVSLALVVTKPSNGIDPGVPLTLGTSITISADTTFDADTGAITGGLVRAARTGVEAGIDYTQSDGLGGGAPLGIFTFHDLTVEAAAKVRFTGTRAVVLVVGEAATIAGALDLSAGRGARATPGPGGGAGGSLEVAAGGCGSGGAGRRSSPKDTGGAGGGAKTAGGAGGSTTDTALPGGIAGRTCLTDELEPLQGGSGGGSGSPGLLLVAGVGGGGGGALQITSLGSLEITGTIDVVGAGGEGGGGGSSDSGGGAGGGAGGAILIEAPIVTIATGAFLAANGGGGGAAGSVDATGAPGEAGTLSRTPAPGGVNSDVAFGSGGAGAAGSSAAFPGGDGISNCGGGGGGAGAIVIRARKLTSTGTISPDPIEIDVQQLRAGSLPGAR